MTARRPRAAPDPREPAPPRSGAGTRVAFVAAALAFLALALTVDERAFGTIGDGKEMLSAAAAIARFGEIGVSRDFANAPPRPAGDAVSRYGMGLSLVEAIPVLVAGAADRVAPGRSTRAWFVLVPILALSAVAASGAAAARALGAPAPAGLGAALVVATPLFGYGASDLSEPLQAALVGAAVAGAIAVRAGGDASPALRAAVGAASGGAVLAKSVLLPAVLPLVLVASARPRGARGREGFVRPALAAFGIVVAIWAAFEFVRFGRLFGGYGDEGFSHPPLLGLVRLTVLPNKGLLAYAPLVVLAFPGFVALWKRDRGLATALAAAAAVPFAAAASWWAWDGQAGWGPRLVLPALPALWALVGAFLRDAAVGRRRLAAGLAAAGVVVNLSGAVVPFPYVYALATAVPPQPIDARRAEGTPYEIWRTPDGGLTASGPHHLSLSPGWWPPLVHARLLALRLAGDAARTLPDGALAGLDPPFRPVAPERPSAVWRAALSPMRMPFLGRTLLDASPQPGDPYVAALRDQAVRASDLRLPGRASDLARRVLASEPAPEEAAIAAEAARALGRDDEARAALRAAAAPCHPWVLYVAAGLGSVSPGCLPEDRRRDFDAVVAAGLAERLPVTSWARRATAGRP